jgi:hypothetical protein
VMCVTVRKNRGNYWGCLKRQEYCFKYRALSLEIGNQRSDRYPDGAHCAKISTLALNVDLIFIGSQCLWSLNCGVVRSRPRGTPLTDPIYAVAHLVVRLVVLAFNTHYLDFFVLHVVFLIL